MKHFSTNVVNEMLFQVRKQGYVLNLVYKKPYLSKKSETSDKLQNM